MIILVKTHLYPTQLTFVKETVRRREYEWGQYVLLPEIENGQGIVNFINPDHPEIELVNAEVDLDW